MTLVQIDDWVDFSLVQIENRRPQSHGLRLKKRQDSPMPGAF